MNLPYVDPNMRIYTDDDHEGMTINEIEQAIEDLGGVSEYSRSKNE